MAELLFEIGMEEMPARFVAPAIEELKAKAQNLLRQAGLYEASDQASGAEAMEAWGTPRRLALCCREVAAQQPDRREEQLGPPLKAAYDDQGNPSKAALGFAKSQGVDPSQLQEIQTDKGPRLGFVKTIPGRPALEVLPELLGSLVLSLAFPKSMRWGSQKLRFARPIHWLLALLDGRVISLELAGIKSGNLTFGHRFQAPQAIEISRASEYLDKLAQAHVVADRQKRRDMVLQQVQSVVPTGGRLVEDQGLVEEVTDLVELPVACCGSFDPEFLRVPRQVVICAMREHQRYFALEDDQGRLLPNFIAVNNTRARDLKVVTQGHERVLRARLADARFFFQEDRKRQLIDCLEDLKEVTFHSKLGTSFEKVDRFRALAVYLAGQVALERAEQVERAALLAKCDLVSEMVGEFPSLQGVVGEQYALLDGEEPAVAAAVREHYLPAGADSDLPQGLTGTLVGLADRIDSLCGFFGVGLAPSGAADPYGLRRAAIAVLRLVSERELELSLEVMLDTALANLAPWLQGPADQVKQEVTQFISARFQGLLAEQGVPTDVAQAVLAAGLDDLTATAARARALAAVKDSPDFAPLAMGMKRVMNILRKEEAQVPQAPPDEALMSEPAEQALYKAFQSLREEAAQRLAQGDFQGFLKGISALKGPIDTFFDDVMVMVEDKALRQNRLALLNEVASLFGRLARFDKLQLA